MTRKILRSVCLALLIALGQPVAADAQGSAEIATGKSVLSRSGHYVEAAVNMATFLASASGAGDKAACMRAWYYEDMLRMRDLAEMMWRYKDRPGVGIILIVARRKCGSITPSIRGSAGIPGAVALSDSSLPGGMTDVQRRAALEGAVHAAAMIAHLEKQAKKAECILSLYGSGDMYLNIETFLDENSTYSAERAIYRSLKQYCEYPAGGTTWDKVKVPETANAAAVREEWQLATKDVATCEAKSEPDAQLACIRLFRKLRAADLASDAALKEIEQEEKALRQEREEMLRRAWRTPDGRPIFESRDGNWYFEDGTVVPPDLVRRRKAPSAE